MLSEPPAAVPQRRGPRFITRYLYVIGGPASGWRTAKAGARTRSSHDYSAGTFASFGVCNDTGIIDLPVSLWTAPPK